MPQTAASFRDASQGRIINQETAVYCSITNCWAYLFRGCHSRRSGSKRIRRLCTIAHTSVVGRHVTDHMHCACCIVQVCLGCKPYQACACREVCHARHVGGTGFNAFVKMMIHRTPCASDAHLRFIANAPVQRPERPRLHRLCRPESTCRRRRSRRPQSARGHKWLWGWLFQGWARAAHRPRSAPQHHLRCILHTCICILHMHTHSRGRRCKVAELSGGA